MGVCGPRVHPDATRRGMGGFFRLFHIRSRVRKPLEGIRALCHGEIAGLRALTEEAREVVSKTGFA